MCFKRLPNQLIKKSLKAYNPLGRLFFVALLALPIRAFDALLALPIRAFLSPYWRCQYGLLTPYWRCQYGLCASTVPPVAPYAFAMPPSMSYGLSAKMERFHWNRGYIYRLGGAFAPSRRFGVESFADAIIDDVIGFNITDEINVSLNCVLLND